MYVKEAIAYTDRAINEAKARGDSEIHLIVGASLLSAHAYCFFALKRNSQGKACTRATARRRSSLPSKTSCASASLHPSRIALTLGSDLLCDRHQLVAELDPHNAGVLIVSLDGRDKGTGNVVQPGEIADRIADSRDDRCVIM